MRMPKDYMVKINEALRVEHNANSTTATTDQLYSTSIKFLANKIFEIEERLKSKYEEKVSCDREKLIVDLSLNKSTEIKSPESKTIHALVDDTIIRLDRIARDFDGFSYGLPREFEDCDYNDDEMKVINEMNEVVRSNIEIAMGVKPYYLDDQERRVIIEVDKALKLELAEYFSLILKEKGQKHAANLIIKAIEDEYEKDIIIIHANTKTKEKGVWSSLKNLNRHHFNK